VHPSGKKVEYNAHAERVAEFGTLASEVNGEE
jgi:hypothetical protein